MDSRGAAPSGYPPTAGAAPSGLPPTAAGGQTGAPALPLTATAAPGPPALLPVANRRQDPPAAPPALPGVGNRHQIDGEPPARAPPPMLPVGGAQPPMLPVGGAPMLPVGGGLPGTTSRQQGLMMPGVGRQQEAPKGHYVTGTITTPVNDPHRRKPQPKPLSCTLPDSGVFASFASNTTGSLQSLPAWARPGHHHDSFSPPSVVSGSLNSGRKASDGHIVRGATRNSTLESSMSIVQSTMSWAWAPEKVAVHCWHRKLEDNFDYNMVNMIGEGRFGAVFIVQSRKSERYYACKHLNTRDHDPQELRNEIDMLRRLDHPNIVRLFEVNEHGDSLFLLMELCHGGDLFARITDEKDGYLEESVARSFAEQMLSALAFCHAMGVVHRDVKPENFLLESENPDVLNLKLADFGLATSIRPAHVAGAYTSLQASASASLVRALSDVGTADGEPPGSYPYMAPELFSKSRPAFEADSWACGVVIYVMLSGDLPYGDDPRVLRGVCEPPDFAESPVWKTVSGEAVDIVCKLLAVDPPARFSARQALQHEWMRSSGGLCNASSHCSSAVGTPQCNQELGRVLLRCLRRWKPMPKLRRLALSALAKRLEGSDPSWQLAQTLYRTFNPGSEELRCKDLVTSLNAALSGMMTPTPVQSSTPGGEPTPGVSHDDSLDSDAMQRKFLPSGSCGTQSSDSFSSYQSPGGSRSITGYNVRGRVKSAFGGVVRKLTRLSEDSTLSSGESPAFMFNDNEDLVSLTELDILVQALDGIQNGTVDFSLLVACVLPPEAYSDETHIAEIFDQFDFEKQGKISPESLQKFLAPAAKKRGELSSTDFKKSCREMIAMYDLNKDGVLDQEEFAAMVQGRDSRSTKSSDSGSFQ